MESNYWTSKFLKAVPGQKEMGVGGNGKTHTRGETIAFQTETHHKRVPSLGEWVHRAHKTIISPDQSRVPSRSEMKRGLNRSLVRLTKAYARVWFIFQSHSF